jgi:hypothetical protein
VKDDLASHLGLDAVLWVQFTDRDGDCTCEVHGIRRHRPASIAVSLALGLALRRAGVPGVARREGDTELRDIA